MAERMFRLLTAMVLATTVVSPLAAAEPRADGFDAPAFIARLEALRREAAIPGLSVAVVRDGSLLLAAGLGHADAERRTPAAADTPYDIASVAKPLSAVVALRLAQDGLLDLDRPMAAYSAWPDFCSGFREQPSIFARDLACDPAPHTLRHLLSHSATGVPGTRFSYNPVLFSWASRPMAAAAGESFSSLVERLVFVPAGMTQSARKHRALPLRADLAARLAPPHRVDHGGVERMAPPAPQGDGAAGGVVATALDLARFDIALDSGALLSAPSRAALFAPTRATDGSALPQGLGWFVQSHRGHALAWHSGLWEQAYSALYLKVLDRGLTFIVLANSDGVWWHNPLDRAEVERSAFAQAFLQAFDLD